MNDITFKIKVAKPKIQRTTSYVTRVCKTCGKEFKIPSWYGKGEYCSRNCADLGKIVKHLPNVVCEYCGKEFYKKPSQLLKDKHHCCSKECMGNFRSFIYSGEHNPNYNNRKERVIYYIHGHKYYDIHVTNHPFSHKVHNIGEYYKEHRYVVEQNYSLFDEKYFVIIDGIHYLRQDVDVHHKNEITTDNRIENLQPMFRGEHISEHNKSKIFIRDTNTGKITGVIKQGELLENHKANDNQQPSIDRNINEGSTTNSRDLASNVEVSNANTSALPNIIGDDIV